MKNENNSYEVLIYLCRVSTVILVYLAVLTFTALVFILHPTVPYCTTGNSYGKGVTNCRLPVCYCYPNPQWGNTISQFSFLPCSFIHHSCYFLFLLIHWPKIACCNPHPHQIYIAVHYCLPPTSCDHCIFPKLPQCLLLPTRKPFITGLISLSSAYLIFPFCIILIAFVGVSWP